MVFGLKVTGTNPLLGVSKEGGGASVEMRRGLLFEDHPQVFHLEPKLNPLEAEPFGTQALGRPFLPDISAPPPVVPSPLPPGRKSRMASLKSSSWRIPGHSDGAWPSARTSQRQGPEGRKGGFRVACVCVCVFCGGGGSGFLGGLGGLWGFEKWVVRSGWVFRVWGRLESP